MLKNHSARSKIPRLGVELSSDRFPDRGAFIFDVVAKPKIVITAPTISGHGADFFPAPPTPKPQAPDGCYCRGYFYFN